MNTEKLAELRAAKVEREKMRAEAEASREAEILELESRFEGELGERGAAFEFVTSADGVIALKLPEAVLTTRFLESKVTAADVQKFATRRLDAKGASIIVVGNAKEFLPELQKQFKDIEVIPIAELDLNSPTLRKIGSGAMNK